MGVLKVTREEETRHEAALEVVGGGGGVRAVRQRQLALPDGPLALVLLALLLPLRLLSRGGGGPVIVVGRQRVARRNLQQSETKRAHQHMM